jgi:transposase
METRRKFTSEFKVGAVKLVLEQGMTRSKVAKDLGLSVTQICQWVNEFKDKGTEAFPGNGKLSPDEKRIGELENEVRQLKMEREILKKATAFFASHGR